VDIAYEVEKLPPIWDSLDEKNKILWLRTHKTIHAIVKSDEFETVVEEDDNDEHIPI
jgi:hypothetical protein